MKNLSLALMGLALVIGCAVTVRSIAISETLRLFIVFLFVLGMAIYLGLSIRKVEKEEQEDIAAKKVYAECREMIENMQKPETKEAVNRLFEATPEELGEAAIESVWEQQKRDLLR